VTSWGLNLEKQQWHRGALTAAAVASQGLTPVVASGAVTAVALHMSNDGGGASQERWQRPSWGPRFWSIM
jgi:hypothetical protein